jgi:hypothetical protein
LDYLNRALKIHEKLGIHQDMAMDLDMIVQVYDGLKQTDKADEYRRKAADERAKAGK